MTTPIGYVPLQVIPTLTGVSAAMDKQLGFLPKAGKDAGKALGDALAAGVDSAARKVEQSSAKVQAARNKEADAAGKARTAEAQLEALRSKGVTDAGRLAAAEEKLAKSKRDHESATKTAARAVKSEADATDKLAEAKKRAEKGNDSVGGGSKGLDALGLSWEGMGTKAAAAGTLVGTAAVAGLTAAAVGAVALGKTLYDLGGTFDETFDSLQIKTGASGPQLDALQQSVRGLSRSVPLSIGEIGTVVGEVSRSLHLTGPQLDSVSKSVANLGRLTGEAIDVRGLGRAFRSFGVDASDQQATLDSLFGAFQKTGIPVNELVATVTKGGPALRQFGFNFGQSAALIGTFEQAGLDADKSIASLTKGLATMAKTQGVTGQEALRQTVTQIKGLTEAGRDADALNLTNKIFGAKGGIQFFDAIKSGALDLQSLEQALETTGASINDTAADTDDFEQKWQTFKNTAAVALEPLASGLFSVVNDGLGSMSDWVVAHQAEIIDFLGDASDGFLAMGKFALIGAGYAVKGFAMLLDPITDTLGGLFKAAAAVDEFFGRTEAAAKERDLAEKFFAIDDSVRSAGDAMVSGAAKIDTLRDSLRGGFQGASDAARLMTALGTATASLPDGKTIKISENTPEIRERLAALGVQVKELPDKTVEITANTQQGQQILDAWRRSAQTQPVTVPVYADMTQAQQSLAKLTALTAAGAPGLASLAMIPAPARGSFDLGGYTGDVPIKQIAGVVHGKEFVVQASSQESIERDHPGVLDYMNATGKLPGYENGGKVGGGRSQGTAEGLNPGADFLRTLVMKTWPQITRIGGRRGEDGYGEHSTGNAIDIMLDNYNTPEGKALGDAVLAMLQSNGPAFDVNGIIWRQTSYGYGGALTAGKPMGDRGSATQNHMDHLHVILGKGRGAGAAPVPAPSGPLAGAAGVQGAAGAVMPQTGAVAASGVDLAGLGLGAGSASARPDPASPGQSSAALSAPSSITGWSSFGLDGFDNPFAKAAGTAVSGQVGSLMGVFGVPDSPGWLQGVSKLIGGISVSDRPSSGQVAHTGSGAAPGPVLDDERRRTRLYDSGGWLPQGVHSVENRSGGPEPILTQDYWRTARDGINVAMAMVKGQGGAQTPIAPVTYNIQARDTEDAFIRAQRQERERAAAKLSRY
ncbi:phage tail tape measure protein [Mycobacteroides abscessus]|uniref:phage tail tape measure protein n=1 Tax=Mycobacteroides abscessus TaxID=36809 RepID=UPI0019D1C526|nr:phage tail tape measure protein [Mycobacteroides abscessus]MBN7570210.1 phage tail tape measure protein [Mycobacteroides abscessus subsp. abscessus]